MVDTNGDEQLLNKQKNRALSVANILLNIDTINICPERPFTLTSGRLSPVYIDCRRIISFPQERSLLMKMGVELLSHNVKTFDAVAGGETAGIPFAAWIADLLNLPMLYIRKNPKEFGRKSCIEGKFIEGMNILLVEDLATDGGSKLNFINSIRDAGGKISHCFVIFNYGNFQQNLNLLSKHGVTLHYLCTWWDVLKVAEQRGYTPERLTQIKEFLNDPDDWNKQQGVTNHDFI